MGGTSGPTARLSLVSSAFWPRPFRLLVHLFYDPAMTQCRADHGGHYLDTSFEMCSETHCQRPASLTQVSVNEYLPLLSFPL